MTGRMARVELFGSITVIGTRGRIAGREFPSRKARQLVALLSLARGRPVTKERIIDQLWRERLPLDPAGALEQVVSVLRRAVRVIDDGDLIVTRPGTYSIAADVDIDLVEFERAILTAREVSDPRTRAETLARAVALGEQVLIADEPNAPWAIHDRRQSEGALHDAVLALAEARLAIDDAAGALAAAHLGLADGRAKTLDDEMHRVEIASLVRLGRRQEARVRLAAFEERLAIAQREPRVDLDALRSMVSRSERVDPLRRPVTTELQPLTGHSGEIPHVGRTAALTTVASQPFVIVHGGPGSGRTRLLGAAAAAVRGPTVQFACLPTDRVEPLLAANRLLRVLGRAAGVTVRRRSDVGGCADLGRGLVDRIGPVTILIDDLDHADPATLAMVTDLAVGDGGCAPRVVASIRSTSPWLAMTSSVASTVELRCLLPEDLAELAGAPQAQTAFAETGGHPATLAACSSAASRAGVLNEAEIASVAGRFLALDPAARSVVATVAALGGSATPTSIASSSYVAPGDLGAVLADAIDSELVAVDAETVRVRGTVVCAAIRAIC